MITLGLLFICSTSLADNNGTLHAVSGDVRVTSMAANRPETAQENQQLNANDTVITGQNGRAEVEWPDGNRIKLVPNSSITIEKYENQHVLLNLINGKIRSQVKKKYDGARSKFQVATPGAAAGVRGTDFVMSYDQTKKASEIVTIKGAVQFGEKGPDGQIMNPVNVKAGMMSRMENGKQAQTPAPAPRDQLQQLLHETEMDRKEANNHKSEKSESNSRRESSKHR